MSKRHVIGYKPLGEDNNQKTIEVVSYSQEISCPICGATGYDPFNLLQETTAMYVNRNILKFVILILATVLPLFCITVVLASDFCGATIVDKEVPIAVWRYGIDGVRPTINSVAKGSLAEKAGLVKGDIISSINNKNIKKSSDLIEIIDTTLELKVFSKFSFKKIVINKQSTAGNGNDINTASETNATLPSQTYYAIQNLISKYGKITIIDYIIEKRQGTVSIHVDGKMIDMNGIPDNDFVSIETINRDFNLMNVDSSEVDKILVQRKDEKDKSANKTTTISTDSTSNVNITNRYGQKHNDMTTDNINKAAPISNCISLANMIQSKLSASYPSPCQRATDLHNEFIASGCGDNSVNDLAANAIDMLRNNCACIREVEHLRPLEAYSNAEICYQWHRGGYNLDAALSACSNNSEALRAVKRLQSTFNNYCR